MSIQDIHNSPLGKVFQKIQCGERLTREDGLILLNTQDISALGYMAHQVRLNQVGNQVYFNNNAHINYTNVCKIRCGLCAFGKDADDPEAYTMTVEQVIDKAARFAEYGITELHIVGGVHPQLPFTYYEEILGGIHERFPDISLKAFTAAEIHEFAEITEMNVAEVLTRLYKVGLRFLPGGGAENFSKRVRDVICKSKISAQRWLEIHETAHQLGIRTNANMLFGTIETPEELVDHLLALRDLQDQTGGFQALIPTAFHPENTQLEHIKPTSGYHYLKVIAVSRLILDNFKFIKAYWITAGSNVAQIALNFGANDLDGVVREEKIYHTAGATTPQMLGQEDLINLIKEAGQVPVERDTFYKVIHTY